MRDWSKLLPEEVAREQRAWERRHSILRAVEAGAQQCDLAAFFGVSRSRVHSLINHAKWEQKYNRRSPIERFLNPRMPLSGKSGKQVEAPITADELAQIEDLCWVHLAMHGWQVRRRIRIMCGEEA